MVKKIEIFKLVKKILILFVSFFFFFFYRVSHTAIPQTLKQMHNVCLKFPPDLVQKQMQLIRKYQRSTISTPSSNMPAAGLLGHPNTTSSHSGPFVGFKANSSSSNSSSNSAPTPLRADVRVRKNRKGRFYLRNYYLIVIFFFIIFKIDNFKQINCEENIRNRPNVKSTRQLFRT